MNKKMSKPKDCPLINDKCSKSNCEIYDETLDRCSIGLLSYNAYKVSIAIKELLEKLK
jgi:hypothetical protein